MESGRLLGRGDGGELLHLRDSGAQEKDEHDVGTPLRLSVSLVPLTYDFLFFFIFSLVFCLYCFHIFPSWFINKLIYLVITFSILTVIFSSLLVFFLSFSFLPCRLMFPYIYKLLL